MSFRLRVEVPGHFDPARKAEHTLEPKVPDRQAHCSVHPLGQPQNGAEDVLDISGLTNVT